MALQGPSKSNVKIAEIPEAGPKVDEMTAHLCSFPIASMSGDKETPSRAVVGIFADENNLLTCE